MLIRQKSEYCNPSAHVLRVNKMLKMVRDMANTNQQQNWLFFKIAITMGATIGISEIVFTLSTHSANNFLRTIGIACFLIQQCVIVVLIMSSKKIL